MLKNKLLSTMGGVSDPYFSSVSLLLHGNGTNGAQNNTFVDSSANNFSVTNYGHVAQGSCSPVPLSGAPYSPTVHGGSAYFDGLSCLSIASNTALKLGTGDFTVETWFYLTERVDPDAFFWDAGTDGTAFELYISSAGTFSWYNGARILESSFTASAGQWYHFAVCRSGTTSRMFVNGVVASTTTDTTDYTSTSPLLIGAEVTTADTYNIKGFMSGARIVKGTALYTANFTPSTAPLAAVTNTSLLLNFTDAGIYDNAAVNNVATFGNAQISTSVAKYGTGSLYFDGTGDGLFLPKPFGDLLTLTNYTIEMWVNPSSIISGWQDIILFYNTGPNSILGFNGSIGGTDLLLWNFEQTGYSVLDSGVSFPLNTWSHLAVVKEGAVLRVFKDGVLGHTLNDPTSGTSNLYTYIGCGDGASEYFNGHLDDIRITRGVARYSANFTPPSQAFTDK